jgi:hypothetical protein
VDAGTQYSPPDFPPTAKRSMTDIQAVARDDAALSEEKSGKGDGLEGTRTSTPPEPSLRQDPRPHTPTGQSSSEGAISTVSETSSLLNSPSKRAKGSSVPKVMPLDYMQCDVRDLGIVISDMLLELIRINDPLPVRNEQLTRYHSRYANYISSIDPS